MGKYDPLKRFLKKKEEDKVEMTFDEIEEVINAELPKSAKKHRPWWANGGHSQADAWLDAGYKVGGVDQMREKVVFVKDSTENITVNEGKGTTPGEPREIDKEKVVGGIALVSCTKSKRSVPSKPKELYMESSLFRKARRYSEEYQEDWYIMSAKHHLLDPEGPEIGPYDETLKDFNKSEKREWSRKIFGQLKRRGLLENKLVIHAGKDYYEELIPLLEREGVDYVIPTEGLSMGNTLSWYNQFL